MHRFTEPRSDVKLRRLFARELTVAAELGTLDPTLFTLLMDVSLVWPLDTQELEGCNSVIKYVVELSPNISWQLLSSRITLKKPY